MLDASMETHPTGNKGAAALQWLVWLLLAGIALRFGISWADALAGASLPRLGSFGFTLIFGLFSLLHAARVFGWSRAASFLLLCAVVSWCFEEVGVVSGLVYGAYHYGDQLGAKLGMVPIIIPLAWFMMIYASWIVAHILLQGAGDPASISGSLARSVIASAVMTAWDVVMDPGMARAGSWTWEHGGAYFGVPFHNFAGWMVTTLTIYLATSVAFCRLRCRRPPEASRLFTGLPAFAYALVALDRLLISALPELHVVAAFGIVLVAMLALLRLALTPERISLPP